MATDTSTVGRSGVLRALRRAELPDRYEQSGADSNEPPASNLTVEAVDEGVNDVFVVDPGTGDGDGLVVKFGTFSTPGHFRAGVAAYRLLGAYTDLPVPAVHAFEPTPADLPPFLVRDHLPGAPLPDSDGDAPDDATLSAVRLLGAVIGEFGRLPETATDGYGVVEGCDSTASGPRAVADYDDCAEMLVAYAATLYADPPDHDALEAVAPTVPDYLRANRGRLPSNPDPAVVVTDLAPGNLLSPGGKPPASGGDPPDAGGFPSDAGGLPPDAGADPSNVPEGLTGVIDLERAKIGPREFTAVNAEYLLTRGVPDPEPYRTALYDALPFGPDLPERDCYRLIAMGRSVNALDLWYDPASEAYRRRGEQLAAEMRRIVS